MSSNPIEIRDGRQEQAALRPEGINRASIDAYSMKSLGNLDQSPSAAAVANLPNLQLFDGKAPATATNTGEFPTGTQLPQLPTSEGSTFSASQIGNDVQSLTNLFSQQGPSDVSNSLNNGTSQLGNLLQTGLSNPIQGLEDTFKTIF